MQTWTSLREVSGCNPSASTSHQAQNATVDEFEAYLRSLDDVNEANEDPDIADELLNLSRQPRLKLQLIDGKEESILEWWHKLKPAKPDLFKLVATMLAIPCTQVSVERTFSALPIILTKFRAQLKNDTLNNILVIRLNSDLLKKVDFNNL